MGRAPCCDKANVKKGPWSPEEDTKLKSYIEKHGTGGNWIALPQKIGLKRCGKSCRLRWLNYLRPNIKHGGFSEEEDNIICSLYISIGSRWSVIAAQLPGRTDNDIKNYWNTRLKKKLLGKHRKEQQARRVGNSSSIKQQEANRGSSVSMVPDDSSHQQSYWPETPVLTPLPCSNQGPCFNDHDSIRRLLIKLGGRFSDDHYQPTPIHEGLNLQFSDATATASTQQIYEEQAGNYMGSSASSGMNNVAINKNEAQFAEIQYCAGVDLVQGQGSFSSTILEEMISSYPQKLDGLEFFYGEDPMVNDKIGLIGSICGQSASWGGPTSLVYPPHVASNYQGMRQEMPQFEEYFRYGA
ncbi:hypothetical protein L6164_024541 [Bauhinia variegata]|uniref:Uncharacterized protein n=1 Tax=Bauhinia variegata TaxID=167791 RepID=A0ACB9LYR4_BAUVA|nr:hypothetical protein L6164_024541 [Bauhinia variegata]